MPVDPTLNEELKKVRDQIRRIRAAFQDAPREEADEALLPFLKREKELLALLAGDGAVAQEDSIALGRQAVLNEGDDNIIVSGKVLGSIYKVYLGAPDQPRLSKEKFERVLGEYLRWVCNACSKARLYGLESLRTAKGPAVRLLKDVFIPLTLRRFRPVERMEIDALIKEDRDPLARSRAYLRLAEEKRQKGEVIPLKRLLASHDRLAVIGGAGSGKSTVLAFLSASLAGAARTGESLPFDLPKGRSIPVPLLIPLRYYREYQALCRQDAHERLHNPRAGTLAGFIPWYLIKRNPALKTSEDFFDRLLLGRGCLLMLDGLDEVVNRDERGRVKQQVENLVNDVYPGNLVLVTARESGYQESAIFGDDFLRLDVQALDDDQIRVLVAKWCHQLYPEDEDNRTSELVTAIQQINARRRQENVPPLVSTPLMTTMVVGVKWGETELPRERARLYEACVRVVLQAQHTPDDDARTELVKWGGSLRDQTNWLAYLAYQMHQGGEAGAAVTEETARKILEEISPKDQVTKFLEAVRQRGGLFEEKAELFQFSHLTFQEFLAARYLAKEREKHLIELLPHVEDPWWREALLLIYGFAQEDHPPFARQYMEWLSNLDGSPARRLAGLELAGTALLELEKPNETILRRQAQRLQQQLFSPEAKTPAVLRARAADTLAQLGDPRFNPGAFYLPADDLLGFVEIPAGKFWMGSDPKKGRQAQEDEHPVHQVDLPRYFIAKYPVTVAQFQVYCKEANYQPENPDSLKDLPTRPVRYVTWYEALRYCRWLTQTLKTWDRTPPPLAGLLQDGWQVTLPSEAEWEKAARGADGRIYPWGNKFAPDRANTAETGLGATSAVGCFPGGKSPYGLLDASGNVWEWTRSLWGSSPDVPDFKYPYHERQKEREDLSAGERVPRILRGGSFSSDARYARCAFRYRSYPDLRFSHVGFRVVLSPFFQSLEL
ncbi:MAG TPA: SUMF1/EgtB/PvdO family nonheme iron enzyme [Anaerolineaceae bacterium]